MNIDRVDLNLLVTLDILIEERNVTRAAQRLHLSQPAVSNALRRLRHVLKDPLLVRTARGMVLTPRAEELAGPVRQALEQLRSSLRANRFDPAQAEHTITVGTTDYVEFVLLPALIANVRAQAPRIKIAVRDLGELDAHEALGSGRMDLAIGYFPSAAAGMHLRKLFDENYVCVARRDHPRLKSRLSLAQFTKAPHVLVSPEGGGFIGPVDAALAEQGHTRHVALSILHFLAVPHILIESDLIVTLTERVARSFCALLPLQILKSPVAVPGYSISALWHERTHHDEAHRWLRELVVKLSKNV